MSILTRELGRASLAAENAARLVARPDPYRCPFHLCPPVGWLNDPNGLCQKDSVFHAYFQYSPLDADGALKFWGHSTSTDLVRWDYVGVALFPDQWFDCHGAYSGSALVEDGKVKVLYTGNVKLEDSDEYNYIDDGRIATQIYTESEDGQNFSHKIAVLRPEDYPAGLTCHIRDPKVWKETSADGSTAYYMLLGARRRGNRPSGTGAVMAISLAGRPIEAHATAGAALVDQGEVLLYKSDRLDGGWKLFAQISTPEPLGYMWECPDWFTVPDGDGTDPAEDRVGVLSFSPQGLQGTSGEEWDRRNVYEAGYFLFENGLLAGSPTDFHLWDGGFDFYAPQSFEAEDGRRILIGWMGISDTPEHDNPTVHAEDAWQHCFTIPREITFEHGRLHALPVRELEAYRAEADGRFSDDALEVAGESCLAFDLCLDFGEAGAADGARITLADELALTYENGVFSLAFSDGSREGIGCGRKRRWEEVGALRNLRVVGDHSTIEAFANDGEMSFSTRYFPKRYGVAVDAPGAKIAFWPLSEERGR